MNQIHKEKFLARRDRNKKISSASLNAPDFEQNKPSCTRPCTHNNTHNQHASQAKRIQLRNQNQIESTSTLSDYIPCSRDPGRNVQ